MKVVVLGCSGMLGSVLVESLQSKFEVVGVSRSEHPLSSFTCDFDDYSAVSYILDSVKADAIINTAAITNLVVCESDVHAALALHFEFSRYLSRRFEKLIYISTDSVFGGEGSNYSETSVPRPLNAYAMTKLAGEYPVLDSGGLVLRTNIYGFNKYKPGNSLFEWAASNIIKNEAITGFSDVYFNPVSIYSLSDIVEFCLTTKQQGLFNVGSDSVISKADFLRKTAECIDPCFSQLSFSHQPVQSLKKPKNTTLDVRKSKVFNFPQVDMLDDLNQVARQYLAHVNRLSNG